MWSSTSRPRSLQTRIGRDSPSSRTARALGLCDPPLQQRPELVFSQPGVADNAAHGERVHRVVSGNGDDPDIVGHHDVLALSNDSKACLLQGSDGVLMVDARNARHVLRGDLNFANDRAFKERVAGGQVSLNRVPDVLERFFLGGALRPAAGQSGN